MSEIKIKNLHNEGSQWFWHLSSDDMIFISGQRITAEDTFFTAENGQGIFFQTDDNDIHQISGLSQFSACETNSGMRRALIRFFNQ